MALYIRDSEVGKLAGRLAARKGLSKTEAVRQALLHELQRDKAMPTLMERGLDFVRDLKQRANPAQARPVTKSDIDALYGDD